MVTLEGVLWYALIFVQKKMGRGKSRDVNVRVHCVKGCIPLSNGSDRACRDQQQGYQGNQIAQW